MQTNEDATNYFEQFKAKLIESQPWPGSYLYKFIVKKDSPHLEQIKSFFAAEEVTLTEKQSAKGTYRSLTILASNQTPDSVVTIYKQVRKLSGVIVL